MFQKNSLVIEAIDKHGKVLVKTMDMLNRIQHAKQLKIKDQRNKVHEKITKDQLHYFMKSERNIQNQSKHG